MQLLAEIDGQDGRRSVVGEPFENLGEIGDPKGRLESRLDFSQTLGQIQRASLGDTELNTAAILAEAAEQTWKFSHLYAS